jgi:branched-chain amino acid aminotransferase
VQAAERHHHRRLYLKGLDIITCGTRRIAPGAFSPQVKSLNYLNNVLAKIEAIQAGAGEGLMLNEQGFVAECTGDNIFILKRGILYTPPISAGGLRGITREMVIRIAVEFGIDVREPEMTRYDIYTADECFLTGTAAEIIPVISLDKRLIGDGKPGVQTAKFIARFRELTQSTGTPIY